jgi:hypothetical protein
LLLSRKEEKSIFPYGKNAVLERGINKFMGEDEFQLVEHL